MSLSLQQVPQGSQARRLGKLWGVTQVDRGPDDANTRSINMLHCYRDLRACTPEKKSFAKKCISCIVGTLITYFMQLK